MNGAKKIPGNVVKKLPENYEQVNTRNNSVCRKHMRDLEHEIGNDIITENENQNLFLN